MVGAFSAQLTYYRYFWVSEINRCSMYYTSSGGNAHLGQKLTCSRCLGTIFNRNEVVEDQGARVSAPEIRVVLCNNRSVDSQLFGILN